MKRLVRSIIMTTEYKEKPTGTFEGPGYGGKGTTRHNCVKLAVFYDEGEHKMLVRMRDPRQPENTYGRHKVIEENKYTAS